jgi:anti-sigma factor RsiW
VHLDLERLQRLLHGELAPGEERIAREHLVACAECAKRFGAIEEEEATVGALLGALDRPAPRVDVGSIARRAEARRPSRQIGRWAAGVALALGLAGVAYAIPGSPVRAWVDSMVEWATGRQDPLSPSGAAPQTHDRAPSGIAVTPGDRFLIHFTSANANGQVLVTLADRADIEIRAPHGAATFTSGADRVVVDGADGADAGAAGGADAGTAVVYEIEIPRSAPRVEIRVAEEIVFLKEGSRVTTTATPAGSGPYLLPMAPPAP